MKFVGAVLAATILVPIPQWGTVSLIEAVWTLVGIIAIMFSLWNLPRVVVDWVLARHATGGQWTAARILIARGHIRRELIRFAQGVIIFAIGVYADIQPNLVPQVTILGLIITAGLVLLAGLVALQSYLDRIQRKQAEEVLQEAIDRE